MMLQLTATDDEIAERLRVDKRQVEVVMQELFEKGVAFPTRKGWRLGRMIDALHDMTLTNVKFWDSYGGKEYGRPVEGVRGGGMVPAIVEAGEMGWDTGYADDTRLAGDRR